MLTFAIVLGFIALVFAVYTVFAPVAMNYRRFSGRFQVPCPEWEKDALVKVKASRAALGSAYGARAFAVRTCTLLKPRDTCGESCLKDVAA